MGKVEAGSLKNRSVTGSGIGVNNHRRRLRGTGGRSPKVWDGRRPMFKSPNIWETRYTHFVYYDQPPRGLSLYFCISDKVRSKWWNYF